ncbi:LysR family transcriptional regulator [Comamonas terrigena]|uniref:LysR family transcriptional regulator n=1 Tax=Comamonas terrigena TaxID=32013 RepID=A0A2A7UTK0_COMTR|nr:LysR family transcriptional regulator [Comamonas terrigena]PEH88689.1 LysR family transcriptional regulator [Comamonas terrigena]BBL23716.1 transcriptional regulator [Comamonas terrigena NBRC 13299]SUY88364.1 D-malate degradation protein R [Comamonas terrigena]
MPINELRALHTFLHTAELGSLRRAAQQQGVSAQAASQALAQLEKHLGVRLFHRTTRSMALTAEGRQLLATVQPAVRSLEQALAGVQHAKDEIAGPLRVVGPRSTFRPVVAPLLSAFSARHPAVQLEVQLDDHVGNWVEDRVDVGFRGGPATAEGVVARRLFALQLIVCAAPAYLERQGAPRTPAELARHPCSVFLRTDTGRPMPWQLRQGDAVVYQALTPAFSTNDEELELQAVLGGQVLGQLTGVTAAPFIRSGRLVPVLLPYLVEEHSLYLYWGSRSAQPARVRAFIDMALETLTENPAFVLGRAELEAAAR